jgi:hypothetical protein
MPRSGLDSHEQECRRNREHESRACDPGEIASARVTEDRAHEIHDDTDRGGYAEASPPNAGKEPCCSEEFEGGEHRKQFQGHTDYFMNNLPRPGTVSQFRDAGKDQLPEYLAVIRGTRLGAVDFMYYAGLETDPPTRMEDQFDAVLYLGPVSAITMSELSPAPTPNTPRCGARAWRSGPEGSPDMTWSNSTSCVRRIHVRSDCFTSGRIGARNMRPQVGG